MLTLFRRHTTDCPRKSRRYRRCKCPIHVEGSIGGPSIRKGTRPYFVGSGGTLIRESNVTGQIGGVLAKTESIHRAIDAYLADCAARKLSPRSIYRYRCFLEGSFLKWMNANKIRDIRSINFEVVMKYRVWWLTWSAYTAVKHLELLRMFLRSCKKCKWIDENPAEELKAPKIRMAPTLPFTREEEQAIYGACDLYRTHNKHCKRSPKRLLAFVMLLLYTGLRIGNACTLGVDKLGDNVQLDTAKTGQPVFVPIPPYVAAMLREQAMLNSNPDYFWTGVSTVKCATVLWQRTINTLFGKAGIKQPATGRNGAHRVRDTAAVRWLESGMPIKNVAMLLGHATTAITEKHCLPWVKSLQDELERGVRASWPEADHHPRFRVIAGERRESDSREPPGEGWNSTISRQPIGLQAIWAAPGREWAGSVTPSTEKSSSTPAPNQNNNRNVIAHG